MSEQQKPSFPNPEEPAELSDEQLRNLVLADKLIQRTLAEQKPARTGKKDAPQGTKNNPENFAARVDEARKAPEQNSAQMEDHFARNRREIVNREKTAKLVKIAESLAAQMNEKRQATEVDPNPYAPDKTTQAVTNVYAENIAPQINKIERGRKTLLSWPRNMVEGWVIARKPIATSGRLLTEEVMLGTDGLLHAYMHSELPNANSLLGQEFSRKDIQDSAVQDLAPPSRVTNVAETAKDLSMNHQILSEASSYPLLGIEQRPGETVDRGISPELIQKGLENLAVQYELDVTKV